MLQPAVHRTILIVDVESFGNPARTDLDRVVVRDAVYHTLQRSFSSARINWADCAAEDRGDGVFVLLPPEVPKSWLVTRLPVRLADSLARHNAACPEPERIRLRMVLHAGEVHPDAHGSAGTSINRAFRLIDAPAVKTVLRESPGVLALIVSDWFYDEVVRHHRAAEPSAFRRVRVVNKETDMIAWVRVLEAREPPARRGNRSSGSSPPVRPARVGPATSALAVRCSLPPDAAEFTGRTEQLDRIAAAVTEAAGARGAGGAGGAGGVVAIHAIGGMPGVGKTALAVHAAYLLRGYFPDRQLFIDLHAHTPGQDPVPPSAALARLLSAVGVQARSLPDDLEGRTELWRDRIAGERALIVLDNAASSDQVAPLLPGGENCLVLVTSRRSLADLPGAVTPVPVEVLPPGQAEDMFARLAPRAAADPAEMVADLVRLAGYLPLAISLLARLYARHPAWGLADLIRETETRLLTLSAEKDSVAAAFELSYRHLDPGRQRFFRRLGLHPGTTVDVFAAAALAGVSPDEADDHLDCLHREALLTETGHRRYGMHDLVRRYARDLAAGDPAAERGMGLELLLDYYQHTAASAEALLARKVRTAPASAAPVAPPAAVPDLPDRPAALSWARTERPNLLACLDHVTRAAQHARVVALTAALAAMLRQDGPWTEAMVRHATAIAAARHLGDLLSMANALDELGIVRRLTGDYLGAARAQQQALDIYRDLGDRQGEANALDDLGTLRTLTDDYQQAVEALEAALAVYRELGDREGQADALVHLGVVRRLTRDHRAAARAQEEALDIYRDLGDQRGQATALLNLGAVRRRAGDYPGAARAQEQALGLYRQLGNRQSQANALCYLGTLRRETGDYQRAVEAQQEALAIYQNLGSRLGQANAISELGAVRRQTGDYGGAARYQEEALDLYRDLGDRGGQTMALCELGAVRRQTGDYQGAAGALDEALAISRDLGDEAEALNELGALYRVRGDLDRARACHRRALDQARRDESDRDEAQALTGLGRCAVVAGQTADAKASLERALDIFQRIGTAEATEVAAEVDALTRAYPFGEESRISVPRPRAKNR
jgi:tetratricopeptide (TPR) repeat protein